MGLKSRAKRPRGPRVSKQSKLSLVAEPSGFFRDKVQTALKIQKVKVEPETEIYLVDLLGRFMLTDNLFTKDEAGTHKEEVLALLLKAAVSAKDVATKQRDLKRLGDVSLYTAGFFSDSLARKVVDVDYYIGMGKTAYGSLSQIQIDQFRKVFAELAARFQQFVDVLGVIRQQTQSHDAKSILRLYEVWLKTKSELAEKSLKEAGIIPNRSVKKDWQ